MRFILKSVTAVMDFNCSIMAGEIIDFSVEYCFLRCASQG